jgi:predicted  nucleic acid-binding Zn ribbon protein
MYINRITYLRHNSLGQSEASSTDTFGYVLHAWRMNGQLLGREYPVLQEDQGFSTIALSPELDSLNLRFNGSGVEKAMSRAEDEGFSVAWQVLGQDAESGPTCSCDAKRAYILFTTYVSLESPIRCLECFRPVAIYHFGAMRNGEFCELISWQSNYQACDRLQMNCRVLEREAILEMSAFDSSLTKDGLAHCETLSTSSGYPFYYYIYRWQGTDLNSERERRCPSCGGEWRLDSRLHSHFDFKCDRCRLLSNIAFDFV